MVMFTAMSAFLTLGNILCIVCDIDVAPDQAPVPPYPYDESAVSGMRVRVNINMTDDFEQPGNRYRYFDPARQVRLPAAKQGLALHTTQIASVHA